MENNKTRRVKIVATAYYDIDLEDSDGTYETTNPEEMLKIDQAYAAKNPFATLDWADEDPTVVLSWEN